MNDFVNALFGGLLIGLSASLMLLLNGRITGISGIAATALSLLSNPVARKANRAAGKSEISWRLFFLFGLLAGGIAMANFGKVFAEAVYPVQPLWLTASAGLLVGFGTRLGLGCTSGHGVCGIGRFSLRSIIATVIFIAAGVVTVATYRALGI
jgi:uncharacterized membrane protein YedE/YeeE